MKHLFLAVLLCLSALYARSQQAATMSVEDCYLVISSDYFQCGGSGFDDSKPARKSLIRISDNKNNYLEAETGSGVLVLWNFRDKGEKRDITAIYAFCGAGCACNALDFRVYDKSGEWEAADDLVPWEEIDAYLAKLSLSSGHEIVPAYVLPQHGSTITAWIMGSDYKLFELSWTGDKFELLMP